jgi:hypothetical protein
MPFLNECIRFTSITPTAVVKTGNFAVGVPIGSFIVVGVEASLSSGSGWTIDPTFTDSVGNTYTLVQKQNATPTDHQLAVFVCKTTATITTGTAWTATINGSSASKWVVLAKSFDDGVSYDTSAIVAATGTAANSGNVTGAQNDQIVVGVVVWDDSATTVTYTPTDGSTAATKARATNRDMTITHRYVSTAGTRNATGTISTSQPYVIAVVTVNMPVAAGGTKKIYNGSSWVARTTTII